MCWQFLLCSAFSSRLPQLSLSLPTTYAATSVEQEIGGKW